MSRFFTANLTIKIIKKQPIVLFVLLITKYNPNKIDYTYIYSQKIIKITNSFFFKLKLTSLKKSWLRILQKNIELVFTIIPNNDYYLLSNIQNKD